MLRNIQSKRLKPRLGLFRATSTITTTTGWELGYADTASIAASSAGIMDINFRSPYRRRSVTIGAQGTFQGGYFAINGAETSGAQARSVVYDNAGTNAQAVNQVMSFGFDSTTEDDVLNQKVLSNIDNTMLLWCKVQGSDGTVLIGKKDIRVTRTGTGVYAVTFLRAFGKAPNVLPMAINTSVRGPRVQSLTGGGCIVDFASEVPEAADTDFYLIIAGTKAIQDTGRSRNPVLGSQRKTRIIPVRLAVSGGTPSISVGTGEATVTDNGVGDFTVTLAKPFKRECIAIAASSNALRAQAATANTTSAIQVQCRNASGTLTDPSVQVSMVIIGSDDTTEY